jgi:hypothetical protein
MWANSTRFHAVCFPAPGCHRNTTVDSCTKFDHTTNFYTAYWVPYIATTKKKTIKLDLYRGSEGGPGDWSVSPSPPVWKSFIRRLSCCQAPVWRCTVLLKENVWFEDVPYAGLQTSEIHLPNCYCSRSSFERRRGPITSWRGRALHKFSVSWNCYGRWLMDCLPGASSPYRRR